MQTKKKHLQLKQNEKNIKKMTWLILVTLLFDSTLIEIKIILDLLKEERERQDIVPIILEFVLNEDFDLKRVHFELCGFLTFFGGHIHKFVYAEVWLLSTPYFLVTTHTHFFFSYSLQFRNTNTITTSSLSLLRIGVDGRHFLCL